jgi:hypothetical protein
VAFLNWEIYAHFRQQHQGILVHSLGRGNVQEKKKKLLGNWMVSILGRNVAFFGTCPDGRLPKWE